MARITTRLLVKKYSQLSKKEMRHKNILKASLLVSTGAAAMISMAAALNPPRTPVRTSALTGRQWVLEILDCPVRVMEQLGMARHVFFKLLKQLQQSHGLSDSRYVSAMEKLAIFLHFARTGSSSRMLQERFQRWEGSAADSRIFEYARKQDLSLPSGYYFLADAGFPLCDMLLTPYRGVRYHLKEWAQGNQK
ncbi:hypothetical protein D9613_010342 [Agrocybe pediades]|uniref:DUF8040 domain-containing protein n=1 Tax=Agrocybe pediades TaxID=84607 RepID=A0A8H4QG09_9AGAR|nr:hypothetical protein D9613_010342 [Agrocybe pediades]